MKCFLAAAAMMMCVEAPVEIDCVKDSVKDWDKDLLTNEALMTSVVYDCLETRQGCCAWHGGVDKCDEHWGYLQCKDGYVSPTCKCGVDR